MSLTSMQQEPTPIDLLGSLRNWASSFPGMTGCLLPLQKIKKCLKLLRPRRMAHLTKGFSLNLAHPLSGHFESNPDLFESLWLPIEKAKTLNQNGPLPIGQCR